MRLIDADLVLKRLEEWNTSDKMDKALYNFARNRIVEQPTAYNIDKSGPPLPLTAASSWTWVDHPVSGLLLLT